MRSRNPRLPEVLVDLRRGALGAEEHLRGCLERIERSNINAFVAVHRERALAQAAALDRERHAGGQAGPLSGLAVAIKDNLEESGLPCAAGCRAYRARVPIQDAEAVRRLRSAGAVVVGRTGMHELADGVTSENPWTGPVHNPWHPGYHPGGSSGGSAAAVAASLVPASLGTDTGGSVRIPASLCGVVGMKPSRNRVPLTGVVPLAPSLDHVGPFAATVAGVGLLLEVLAGPEGRDLARAAREPVADLRLGVLANLGLAPDPGVAERFHAARIQLLASGFSARTVEVEGFERALSTLATLYGPEMAALHGALLSAPAEDVSPALRADLERSLAVPAEKRAQAEERRRALSSALESLFDEVDVLMLPTTPHPARPFGSPDPHTYMRYTCAFNLSGQPAISLPMGRVDGLPVGLQLVARRGADAELLRAAAAAERVLQAG